MLQQKSALPSCQAGQSRAERQINIWPGQRCASYSWSVFYGRAPSGQQIIFMKKIVCSEHAPAPVGPYSQAVVLGGTLYVSGQIPLDPHSGLLVSGTIEEETHQVMKNIGAILQAAGCGFGDIVKCSVFVTDINDFARINAVYATYFDADNAPARELVQVAALPKGANVEISVIAAAA